MRPWWRPAGYREGRRAPAAPLDLPGHGARGLEVQVEQRHPRAAARELKRGGRAKARAGARDQRSLSVDVHRRGVLFSACPQSAGLRRWRRMPHRGRIEEQAVAVRPVGDAR